MAAEHHLDHTTAGKTLVLCEPPFLFWDRGMDGLREGEETIPGLGLLVLAAVARDRGYRVHLVDAKRPGVSVDAVARQILALRPDYVGLSATTVSVTSAARIAMQVTAEAPRVVTILGGAHVSAVPERTLDAFPSIDYGIVGEGEVALFELLARLERCVPVDDVGSSWISARSRSSPPTQARPPTPRSSSTAGSTRTGTA